MFKLILIVLSIIAVRKIYRALNHSVGQSENANKAAEKQQFAREDVQDAEFKEVKSD